ncbi:hypothetical protein QYE76_034481 [Lolium multiflorum]|uniref:Uncharacterized protein n=1 Tax=Lolium multiflorum TaxID=4521 RepID=A0AAD8QXG9_LOLMU|nr:hypothetical protein QYE76_034481 [Lolium multiflorum]
MRRLRSLAGGRSRTYAERFPSLLDPLPGLHLPPAPHDEYQQSPPPPPLPRTEVTTLPNGVRIASQDIPGPMCCVGVTVAAGSVHETPSSAGAAYMLERLAFHETQNRGLGEIALSVDATGGKLGAEAGRERMFYSFGALRASLPLTVEVLLDCVRNPAFLRNQVRSKVAEAQEELSFLESDPELFLRESLHRVGYSGALGNPLFPTKEALAKIDRGAIRSFYFENYTADRLVLAASGVNHQHLLDIAAPLLSDLPKGSPVHKPKSAYTGGDFRHKTDSEMTHVAMAFEVPGGWHQEKAAIIMKVMQTLMGGGASYSSGGPGKGMQSRLYLRVMVEYDWMQSISAFSTVYDDTGLFGIHLAAPSDLVAEAVDIAIRELTAIARPGEVTEAELGRAKNLTISSILQNLESRDNHAEDMGRQILVDSSGKASQDLLERIDEVTLDDITSVAQKMLSSCPTMASWGDVGKVPTHEYVQKLIESPPSDLMWMLKSFFS